MTTLPCPLKWTKLFRKNPFLFIVHPWKFHAFLSNHFRWGLRKIYLPSQTKMNYTFSWCDLRTKYWLIKYYIFNTDNNKIALVGDHHRGCYCLNKSFSKILYENCNIVLTDSFVSYVGQFSHPKNLLFNANTSQRQGTYRISSSSFR